MFFHGIFLSNFIKRRSRTLRTCLKRNFSTTLLLFLFISTSFLTYSCSSEQSEVESFVKNRIEAEAKPHNITINSINLEIDQIEVSKLEQANGIEKKFRVTYQLIYKCKNMQSFKSLAYTFFVITQNGTRKLGDYLMNEKGSSIFNFIEIPLIPDECL